MDFNRTEKRLNIDQIIAGFLQAVEADPSISAEDLISKHPEFASELVEFFEDKKQIDRLAVGTASHETANEAADTVTQNRPMDRKYFGDYELLEEIARGGMGVVFKARQLSLDRIVALKMILSGTLASEAEIQRFQIEAEAAAKLDHPAIVPIYEMGEYHGQRYMAMGYVNGPSLADQLADGPIPPQLAAEWLKNIALGVSYAHERGVVHRDLKPSNILLAPNRSDSVCDDAEEHTRENSQSAPVYVLKIADFGLAKSIEADNSLTGTGQILGTPNYMAPEQITGGPIGPEADLYALGSILYALLTGRPPFQAESAMKTMAQVVEKQPLPPQKICRTVPNDLETICLKLLAKTPEQRYRSCSELIEELQLWQDGKPINAKPIGKFHRAGKWVRRNPIIASLLAATFFAMVASLGALQQTSQALRKSEDHLYDKQIRLATIGLESGHRTQAIWALKATNPRRRGWEYYHLLRRCKIHQDSFYAHDSQVCFDCTPPRGMQKNGTIINLETGEPIRQIENFEIFLEEFANLRHGRFCIGRDPKKHQHIQIFDLLKDRVCGNVQLEPVGYKKLVVSADGSRLIAIDQSDSMVTWSIWSVATGRKMESFGQSWSLFERLSDDNSQILIRSLRGSVEYFVALDINSGKELFKCMTEDTQIHRFLSNHLIIERRGRGNKKGKISCVHANGVHYFGTTETFQPGFATLSQDGQFLAFVLGTRTKVLSGTSKKELHVWRCRDWKRIGQPLSLQGHIASPVFSPNNRSIYCEVGGTMELPSLIEWDWMEGKIRSVFRIQDPSNGRTVKTWCQQVFICASPGRNPKLYATNDLYGDVDCGTLCSVWKLNSNNGDVIDIGIRPARIFFSNDSLHIGLLDSKGRVLSCRSIADRALESKSKNARPPHEYFREKYRHRQTVDLGDGSGIAPFRYPAPDGKSTLVFQPPSYLPILGLSGIGTLSLEKANKKTWPLTGHAGVLTAFAFSPDGRFLATATTRQAALAQTSLLGVGSDWGSDEVEQRAEIKIWKLSSGRLLQTMRGHSGLIQDLAFSPDGSRLATAGNCELGSTVDQLAGGQILLWDVATGQRRLSLSGGIGDFGCVDFSPDGNYLAATGTSKLHIWSAMAIEPAPRATLKKLRIKYRPTFKTSRDKKVYYAYDMRPAKRQDAIPMPPPQKSEQFTKATIKRLAELPEIEVLRLSSFYNHSNNPTIRIPEALPNVKSMSVAGTVDRNDLSAIARFDRLESLKLTHGISGTGVELLLKCVSLNHLKIKLANNGQLETILQHPSLTSLSTNIPSPNDAIVVDAMAIQRMERLRIRIYRDGVTNLSWIGQIENLRALTIEAKDLRNEASRESYKSSYDDQDMIDWSFCQKLHALQELEYDCQNVAPTDLQTLLRIRGVKRLSIKSVVGTINFGDLQKLDFPTNLIELRFSLRVIDGESKKPVERIRVLKFLREQCPDAVVHYCKAHRWSTWEPAATRTSGNQK